MKVVLSAAAGQDFTKVGDYIAEDSPERVTAFVQTLRRKVSERSRTPLGFPLVARYRQTGVRRRRFGNYLIFYRIDDDQISVVRILHRARDYEKLLFDQR